MKKLFFIILGLALTNQNVYALSESECQKVGKHVQVNSRFKETVIRYVDCVSEQSTYSGTRTRNVLVLPNSKVWIHFSSKKASYDGSANIGNGLTIDCGGDGKITCTCNGNPCSTQ